MWKETTLGEICEFVRGPFGGSLKKNIFVKEGYAVYEQQHAIKNQCKNFRYYINQEKFLEMQRFIVKSGDILMSCSGTIGKTTIVPADAPVGIINQALLKITTSNVLNVHFLKFYMQSKLFHEQLMETVDGAAIKNVASVKILKNITINLPPLAEQERIVAKLDATFAEIDRTIEALESKKQEANKLKALLLSEKLCFTSHKKIKIGDVLKTSAGGTPLKSHKEYYENGDINWLLSGAVNKQNIIKCRTHITQQGLQNSSAKVFPINTVLVAMYGATAGQVGILRIEAATNQAVCGIYPSSEYLPEFLYFYLENYKKTLLEEASGTAQPNISQIKIKNVPLPVISISDQQEIISLVETIFLNLKKFTITLDKSKDNYLSLKSAILVQELQSSEAA
jgi:type I restriction enzyme, S subunit